MAIQKVVVVDGNNLIVRIDRGVAGRSVTDVVPIEIDNALYLEFYFSDGTTETVGPVGTIQYIGTSPIVVTGSTISLSTVPVNLGGTGATTASGARTNLGLGSISTQDASSVAITGGSITGITDLAVADGGTGASTASGARTNLGLGTIATQDSSNVSITGGSITGITDLAIADGGTGASTASGARSNLGLGTSATLNAGVANGVATLDSGGTVPLSQIPASIQGGVSYQGSWNASTNTPTLTSSVGSKGYYYVVSVAGNTNLNGVTDWLPGDWAIFNGTVWEKIDNTDAVASVNGYTGVVVLSASDVGAPPTSRTISAGTGLSGGGDLSANRTLSLANTAVTAASYGNASSVGTFTVNAQGQLTAAATTAIAIANTQVSGLGTISTQDANSVAITGGTINGTSIGATTTSTGAFTTLAGTTISASTKVVTPYVDAVNSAGAALRNASGTSVIQWGAGGTTNSSVNGSINLNGVNAQIDISPTGTGHVHINPAGSGSVEINPTNTGTINNMAIGGTTPSSGAFTTLSASTAIGIASGGTGQTTANAAFNALAPTQTGNSGKYLTTDGTNTSWAANPLGTVTSVSGTGTVNGLTLTGTVTTSGDLTLGGTLDLSAPPAIGGTTPNSGAFTTLSASGNVTLSGGTANGVLYLNGSKVATSGSALTFDGTKLDVVQSGASTGGSVIRVYNTTDGVGAGQLQIAKFGSAASYGPYSANTVGINAASTSLLLGTETNNPVIFYQTNSEQMRLTSTGLGIGTSSPSNKLTVNSGASTTTAQFTSTGSSVFLGLTNSGASAFIGADSTGAFLIQTPGSGYSTKLTVTTDGNLGLGVTPSAWSSVVLGLQVRNASLSGTTTQAFLSQGVYYNSGWKHIGTGASVGQYYIDDSGQHIWYRGAGGSAGAAVSFTQAMTLDAGGNLLVGTTDSGSGATAAKQRIIGAASNNLYLGCTSAGGWRITSDALDDAGTFYHIKFAENGTQRGSITSNGSSTTYATSSDYRLKNVIGEVTGAGARIDTLEPVEYEWKENGQRTRGFLAHKFQEVYPQSVTGTKDAVDADGNPVYQAMQASTSEVIADLVAEIQSLRKRLADAGIA